VFTPQERERLRERLVSAAYADPRITGAAVTGSGCGRTLGYMATLDDPSVKALLDAPNHAVISTFNPDGSIHSTVAWQEVVDGALNVNSAVGRRWPTNLDTDPRVTVVVLAQDNPYEYVEVRGTASRTDGADEQIDRLAKKYLGQDRYPFRGQGEQRVRYVVTADRVRHQKQG
jgi:PPOX class probable F420-dependent enzyme